LPTGSERILLVDDEPSIVTMIRQMLERLGYKISGMTDSTATLERFKTASDDFDLSISIMLTLSVYGK
jgi:CheY-like chemotaxis protein